MKEYPINGDYSFKGEWWHCVDPSTVYSGELTYSSKDEKAFLILWGSADLKTIDFYNDTFLGVTSDSMHITITHLQMRASVASMSQSKKYEHTIEIVGSILIGIHFASTKEIEFNNLLCRFSDQIYFIQRNGFAIEHLVDVDCISYRPIESIVLCDCQTTKWDIVFSCSSHLISSFSNEAIMKQKEYFRIQSKDDHCAFEYLVNQMRILRNFMTFSLNTNVYIEECIFHEKNATPDKEFSRNIYLLDQSLVCNERKSERYNSQIILFDLREVENGKVCYKNWLKIYEEKGTSLNMFFSIRYRKEAFLEETFLSLMHTFEDYHRHCSDLRQGIESTEDFEKKMDAIIASCPKEYQRWLRKALKYSNEINLNWRINTVFMKYNAIIDRLIADKQIRQDLIDKIVHTRNYLTHGSESAKEKALKNPQHYFCLNDLIYSLVTLLILSDLGLDMKEIDNKIFCVPAYYNRLDFEWQKVQ